MTILLLLASKAMKGHALQHGLSCKCSTEMEARVGFEPTLTVLQTGS